MLSNDFSANGSAALASTWIELSFSRMIVHPQIPKSVDFMLSFDASEIWVQTEILTKEAGVGIGVKIPVSRKRCDLESTEFLRLFPHPKRMLRVFFRK